MTNVRGGSGITHSLTYCNQSSLCKWSDAVSDFFTRLHLLYFVIYFVI